MSVAPFRPLLSRALTALARPFARPSAALLALPLVLGGPALAAPVTLGFDELPTTEYSSFIGNSYVNSGFSVTTNAPGFIVWGGGPGYLGSAALMAWGTADSVRGVARVSWHQGTSDAQMHEFDNLVLEALPPQVGSVP